MYKRREFIKMGTGALASLTIFTGSFFSAVQWALAKAQRTILPKGTKRERLVSKNPETLDTRNLELTELKDFKTMGITDHDVNLDEWRLEISGNVNNQIKLTYVEV